MSGPQQMAPNSEEILDDTVDGGEALEMAHRLEAAHLTFALSRRFMRDLGSVIRVLIGTVHDRRHHDARGDAVASQLVGDEPARGAALPFQQLPEEPNGGVAIPSRLHQHVQHVAVLIHGSPQVLLAAVNPDKELIEIPRIALAASS